MWRARPFDGAFGDCPSETQVSELRVEGSGWFLKGIVLVLRTDFTVIICLFLYGVALLHEIFLGGRWESIYSENWQMIRACGIPSRCPVGFGFRVSVSVFGH